MTLADVWAHVSSHLFGLDFFPAFFDLEEDFGVLLDDIPSPESR